MESNKLIPGWSEVDPLTLPFRERPSVLHRYVARSGGLTYSEARDRLGLEWSEDRRRYVVRP